jgi:nicotinate-nucleotide pyrophosphorylase
MLDNFTHETIGAAAAAVKAAYPHTLVEASGVREIKSLPA